MPPDHNTPPAAYTVERFCHAYGIGRTKLYDELKQRRLKARKVGKTTLILRSDAEAWAQSLPVAGRQR
jgi:excisionase family DNA binding protein